MFKCGGPGSLFHRTNEHELSVSCRGVIVRVFGAEKTGLLLEAPLAFLITSVL